VVFSYLGYFMAKESSRTEADLQQPALWHLPACASPPQGQKRNLGVARPPTAQENGKRCRKGGLIWPQSEPKRDG
jgi:hypothetical protein